MGPRLRRALRELAMAAGMASVGAGLAAYDWRVAAVVIGVVIAAGAVYGMTRDAR